MKRVTGIGGIFIKCQDLDRTRAWYEKHLGIPMESWGAQFNWSDHSNPGIQPYSIFSCFKAQTDYFDPSDQPFMINFRVADLDALIPQLQSEGITLIGGPLAEEYGKFAWIMDPEGNKIELWEQTS